MSNTGLLQHPPDLQLQVSILQKFIQTFCCKSALNCWILYLHFKKFTRVATPEPRSGREDPSRTLPRTAFGRASRPPPCLSRPPAHCFFDKSNLGRYSSCVFDQSQTELCPPLKLWFIFQNCDW